MGVGIWILEDDDQLGDLLQIVLSGPAGVEVKLFTSGEEALRDPATPDIVFADTHLLGKMTGPEAVAELQKRNPNLAVVYSSAMGLPVGVQLRPQDRVMPKPFDVCAIREMVCEMITKIPRIAPPTQRRDPTQPEL